ncbi:hypothetical protein EV179_005650 [Coemansia sp. RSA 487]|nr:hypothetical protein LPJ74_005077 [Coemansia sp. RSA 1843]KAJ2086423.1 hypothetical protein IW138_005707 [Coemansia sp. RSA 986]KAJ2211239.1 hypothetical protein EV179_005650 [Coemansia sp. RSA 487]
MRFTTRVLSALATKLEFGSFEDGTFTASGDAAEWIDASRQELRAGNCVALPTETVYGLAANALDPRAVQAIYAAKGRPSDNPLIVHVSSIRMLRSLYHMKEPMIHGTDNAALEQGHSVVWQLLEEAERKDIAQGGDGVWPEIPRVYHDAIRRFWPGPLTIVMPRPACIPIEVLGGHGHTVAFRFPAHPVARAIIEASGVPVAAPSANASGRPSPTLALHVRHDLDGRLPLIVDGGACDVGVESTVVDGYSGTAFVEGKASPCVLRPGGVTVEDLQALGDAWKRVRVYRRDFSSTEMEMNPTTPGMKYKHYSPTAPVYVVRVGDQQEHQMQQVLTKLSEQYEWIGVVVVGDTIVDETTLGMSCKAIVHRVADARGLAHSIFAYLRELDETDHVQAIVVQGVGDAGEGLAVMNRIDKAASYHA